MTKTIIEQLADFAADTDYDRLPADVARESKRAILDSIGCALAAIDQPRGKAGIEYGRLTGGAGGDATIIGTDGRVSIFGAAFANGELINTLDMDAVLPPGHVSPYVIPGILAVGESLGLSGKQVIAATAVAHEMSNRMGKAVDYLRDTKDGNATPPKVFGYSCTVFGAAAAIAKLRGLSRQMTVDALGIAGCIAPVQSQVAWFQHAPNSTIKYLHAGILTQTAFTASYMAELGHRGDVQVLDDREYGYPRFTNTTRWEPNKIVDGLGEVWYFPKEASYKPYPHCRIMHALFDALIDIVETNDIKPHEIEHMTAWIEGFAEQPCWTNREIKIPHDAQFSMAHGLALAAHRVPPGKDWQDPALVFSDSVMSLMGRTDHIVHPDYVKLLSGNPASRPAHIEVTARGQTFIGERRYPRGSNNVPEPGIEFTDEDLVAKYRHNAQGVLPEANIEAIAELVMNLEAVDDLRSVMQLTSPSASLFRARAAE